MSQKVGTIYMDLNKQGVKKNDAREKKRTQATPTEAKRSKGGHATAKNDLR